LRARQTHRRQLAAGALRLASARRHRFTLIRDTRNRFAISRSLAPASIRSAAFSRTISRRAVDRLRLARVVGKHEDWGVEPRIIAPE
jgi:hypothetical protein